MIGDSLSAPDLAAFAFFVLAWVGHSLTTAGRFFSRPCLSQLMNAQREAWLRTMAGREMRMVDTGIMTGLQQGTAFFASSSLIALGGCFALLQASDAVVAVLANVPYSPEPTRALFEDKVLGLMIILAYAFFKFGWSYRLFNYCSILIGAVPQADDTTDPAQLERCVGRAVGMNIVAGGHFNAGLRAMFFSIGYLGWFLGPIALGLTTVFILTVLVRRQYFSEAREALTTHV
nr:DUF599 family protein [Nitratireductor arenosus]